LLSWAPFETFSDTIRGAVALKSESELLVASTDGTDPVRNGRSYELTRPRFIPDGVAHLVYGLTVLSALAFLIAVVTDKRFLIVSRILGRGFLRLMDGIFNKLDLLKISFGKFIRHLPQIYGVPHLSYVAYLLVFTYLITESTIFTFLRLGVWTPNLDGVYFQTRPRDFHPVRGAIWVGGERGSRIANGALAYDRVPIRIDSRGYIGSDLSIPADAVKRYAVLGDSFTDADYLPVTWPEQAVAATGRKLALVPYGFSGGGVLNWASVYKNEILTAPRVDGVIIAAFGDNISRGFYAGRTDRLHYYYDRFNGPDDAIAKSADFNSCVIGYVVGRRFLDWVSTAAKRQYEFGPNTAYLLWRVFLVHGSRIGAKSCAPFHHAQPRYDLLDDIVTDARARGLRVFVATIPRNTALMSYLRTGEKPEEVTQLEAFAVSRGVPLFDGFELFARHHPDRVGATVFVNDLWLSNDGHWNQKGADLFANNIGPWLLER